MHDTVPLVVRRAIESQHWWNVVDILVVNYNNFAYDRGVFLEAVVRYRNLPTTVSEQDEEARRHDNLIN